jgi:hypothetical protein
VPLPKSANNGLKVGTEAQQWSWILIQFLVSWHDDSDCICSTWPMSGMMGTGGVLGERAICMTPLGMTRFSPVRIEATFTVPHLDRATDRPVQSESQRRLKTVKGWLKYWPPRKWRAPMKTLRHPARWGALG